MNGRDRLYEPADAEFVCVSEVVPGIVASFDPQKIHMKVVLDLLGRSDYRNGCMQDKVKQIYKHPDAAYVVSVSVGNENIYVLESRQIDIGIIQFPVVELLERTHRTVDKNKVVPVDKVGAVLLIGKSGTPSKKCQHRYSSGPIRLKISNPSALPLSFIGFSNGSNFMRPFTASATERLI